MHIDEQSESNEAQPKLGFGVPDVAASAIRGVGALIPHGGKAVASLLASLVPGQRSSRIDKYISILNDRTAQLEDEQLKLIASSPEHIDLFEEGAFRAARALNDHRIDRIAYTVAVGMTKGTVELSAQRRLLTIFSDLDEDDIIVLKWYIERNGFSADEYANNHPHLIGMNKFPVTSFSTQEEREAEALRKAIDNKLYRFNLIEIYETPATRNLPAQKMERITELGKLILRTAGVLNVEESR